MNIRAHLAPFFVCRLRSCTSMYTPSTANRKKCAICNPSLRFGSLANVCLHCLRRSCTSQCTLPPKIKIRAHLQNEYKGASSAFFRLWVAVIYVLVNSLTPKSKEKRFSKLPYPQIERKTLSATLLFILGSRIIWRCCDFLFCNPSSRFGSLANVCLHCFWRSFTQNEYKGASSALFRTRDRQSHRLLCSPKMNITAHIYVGKLPRLHI